MAALKEQLAVAEATKAELEKQLSTAQDYIQRQMTERQDTERKFHALIGDLITRLQTVCAQRDEARGNVLELQDELANHRTLLAAKESLLVAKEAELAGKEAALPAAAGTIPTTSMANGMASAAVGSMTRGVPGYAMDAKNLFDNLSVSMGLTNTPSQPARPGDDTARPPTSPGMATTPSATAESEVERKAREMPAKTAAQQQDEERLLVALSSPLGFHKGRPVAALLVFRSCLHWRSFQADRTTLFDRIIGVIGSQIEKQQDDNILLSYLLTNTVTLLHLLHKNIKPAINSSNKARPVANAARNMFPGILSSRAPLAHAQASIHEEGSPAGGFKHVEAKYPALLFKQQLDAFVREIFPMIRDNVKKQIGPMLANCHLTQSAVRRDGADAGAPQAALTRSWGEILTCFDHLLAILQANSVPKVLVQAMFKQLFSFVNVQLFNQLLLRRECCSFSNGEYVKTGLAQVETWIQGAGTDYVADSWDELKHLRQAVSFIVIGDKAKKGLEEITSALCPALSSQQLYRISTMYHDDKCAGRHTMGPCAWYHDTEGLSANVLEAMKKRMMDSNSSQGHSFLLDDDTMLPFSAPEVLSGTDDKDLFLGLPVPDALKDIQPTTVAQDGSGMPLTPPSASGSASSGFAFMEKELLDIAYAL